MKTIKHTALLTLSLLFSSLLFSQSDVGEHYHITFDDTTDRWRIQIDTVNDSNNIWQIGSPQLALPDSSVEPPFGGPRAIITDTANIYPVNDTSSFTLQFAATWRFQNSWVTQNAAISARYSVESSANSDYGTIDFSPDNGRSWVSLTEDTLYGDLIDWWPGVPALSGMLDWNDFTVDVADLGDSLGVFPGDTMLLRFTFISDSIADTLNGLMYDNIQLRFQSIGINEYQMEPFSSVAFPNPASEVLNIHVEDETAIVSNIQVLDQNGVIILDRDIPTPESKFRLETRSLSSGIYHYVLIDAVHQKVSKGKFIVTR